MENKKPHTLRVRVEDTETGKLVLDKTDSTVLVVTCDALDRADNDANMKYSFSRQGDLGEIAMIFATHPCGQEILNAALALRLAMDEPNKNLN